jgi:hypothetical protein
MYVMQMREADDEADDAVSKMKRKEFYMTEV